MPLMRVASKLLSLFKDCWYTHGRYCYNLSQVVLGYPGIMIPGKILGGSMPGEPVDPGILRFPGFLGGSQEVPCEGSPWILEYLVSRDSW